MFQSSAFVYISLFSAVYLITYAMFFSSMLKGPINFAKKILNDKEYKALSIATSSMMLALSMLVVFYSSKSLFENTDIKLTLFFAIGIHAIFIIFSVKRLMNHLYSHPAKKDTNETRYFHLASQSILVQTNIESIIDESLKKGMIEINKTAHDLLKNHYKEQNKE